MDGAGIIRRLSPIELDRIRAHLLRLDPESRRLRFGGLVGPAQIEAHCAGLEATPAVLFGYVADGAVRALGELLPTAGSDRRRAELAISVERRWRNRGIGTELLRRLIGAARNRLIDRLYMVCLIDNGRMLRLARRFDGRLSVERGEALARIEPPWPTFWTLLEETLGGAPVIPRRRRHPRRAEKRRRPVSVGEGSAASR